MAEASSAFPAPEKPGDEEAEEEKVERDYAVEVSGRALRGQGDRRGAGAERRGPGRRAAQGAAARAQVRRAVAAAAPGELVSPIQGTVLKVAVEQGADVEEGALICVIEAMKMENEITAPSAGTVEELSVSEGGSVATGDTDRRHQVAAAVPPRLAAAGAGDDRHAVLDRRARAARGGDRRDLGASVSAVGLARSVLAGVAVAVSLAIGPLIDRIGVRPLLLAGGALALAGAALTAAAPSLGLFYAAHAVSGAGVACLLSAGFAGVRRLLRRASAPRGRSAGWWARSRSPGSSGNPLIGLLAEARLLAARLPRARHDRRRRAGGRPAGAAGAHAGAGRRHPPRGWPRSSATPRRGAGRSPSWPPTRPGRPSSPTPAPSTSRTTASTRARWASCWPSARWSSS